MSTGVPSGPGRKKRGRGRAAVPAVERVISVAILCGLAGIGVTVWHKGHHFDPALYSVGAEALTAPAAASEGQQPAEKAAPSAKPAASNPAGESTGTGDAHAEGGTQAVAAQASAGSSPMDIAVPGTKPMGETEFYNPDRLFEKIDGRAGAYLGFNFQGLRCRSFGVAGSKGAYVDVYEFRMDTPVNAFGIFALERDPKGQSLPFAPDGYSGEMGFYFRQAAYYIQVIASDPDPKTMAVARAIAEDRAKAFPADDAGLDARRRLPAAGMLPESVKFIQDNAQGQSFLKGVFQATYDFGGVKLPFFVMMAKPGEAADAWKQYNAFCSRFGKAAALPPLNGAQIFQAQSFGKWRVIYQKDGEIGGVFDALDGEKARQFVEGYLKGEIK